MSDKMVTIKKSEHDRLVDDSKFLACLNACGVDSWEGYDEALELMEEEE